MRGDAVIGDHADVFDGQGIPDSFNTRPLQPHTEYDAPHQASRMAPSPALVIGVGVCDISVDIRDATAHSDAPTGVIEFCQWDIETTYDTLYNLPGRVRTPQPTIASAAPGLKFSTHQSFAGGYSLTLTRIVSLHGRTVRSETKLENTGGASIPLSWFPHPFFPQSVKMHGSQLCKLNYNAQLEPCEGYITDSSGWVCAKEPAVGGMGYLSSIPGADKPPLSILQAHPSLGFVGATCSYHPTFFPIWSNEITFSWEPYLERTVAPGQVEQWSIDYDFAAPAEVATRTKL